jgi:hypothetical protein
MISHHIVPNVTRLAMLKGGLLNIPISARRGLSSVATNIQSQASSPRNRRVTIHNSRCIVGKIRIPITCFDRITTTPLVLLLARHIIRSNQAIPGRKLHRSTNFYLWQVAPISSWPNHKDRAPGPSPLGTGDTTNFRANSGGWRTLFFVLPKPRGAPSISQLYREMGGKHQPQQPARGATTPTTK